jgi:hypothetical protein
MKRDFTSAGAHAEKHRDCVVNGEIVEPVVANAP